jgi:hypothetical protein
VDFFPYADNGNSWWTGYYTSRPQLKQAIRRTMATLRAAESVMALARPWASAWQATSDALLLGALDDAVADDRLQGIARGAIPYASFSWLSTFQRLEQVRAAEASGLPKFHPDLP